MIILSIMYSWLSIMDVYKGYLSTSAQQVIANPAEMK